MLYSSSLSATMHVSPPHRVLRSWHLLSVRLLMRMVSVKWRWARAAVDAGFK